MTPEMFLKLEKTIKAIPDEYCGIRISDAIFSELQALIGKLFRKEKLISPIEQQLNFNPDIDLYKKHVEVFKNLSKIPFEKQILLILESNRTVPMMRFLDQKTYTTQHNKVFWAHDKNSILPELKSDEIENYVKRLIYILEIIYKLDINNDEIHQIEEIIEKFSREYRNILIKFSAKANQISKVILHADNHPQMIYWCIAARLHRVPVILLQHGADCEPAFLDEFYSDHLFSWGTDRIIRYQKFSTRVPKTSHILGDARLEKNNIKESTRLTSFQEIKVALILRPITPDKAYTNLVDLEGAMKTIRELESSNFIKNVYVKIHPADLHKNNENSTKLFKKFLKKSIIIDNLDDAIQNADVVISEDSSAIIDSVREGKPTILTHYHDYPSIIDVEKFSVGTLVHSPEKLIDSIKDLAEKTPPSFEKRMAFLDVYCSAKIENPAKTAASLAQTNLNPKTNLNFCTVVSSDYLKYAISLAERLGEIYSEINLCVLLIDGKLSEDNNIRLKNSQITIHSMADLPDLWALPFSYYDNFELSCIIKPAYVKWLSKNNEKWVYLDSDILIHSPFNKLEIILDSEEIVLSPHTNLGLPIDQHHPTDIHIARYGIFNGGFWAIRRSQISENFLDWWISRNIVYGFNSVDQGMSGDQPTLAVASLVFFNHIYSLRNPEYNVAYWNLHERAIEFRNGEYFVEKNPLVFFHFSGFSSIHSENISTKANNFQRIKYRDHPAVIWIAKEYEERLIQANTFFHEKLLPHLQLFDLNRKIPKEERLLIFKNNISRIHYVAQNHNKPNLHILLDRPIWDTKNGSRVRIFELLHYLEKEFMLSIIFVGKMESHYQKQIENIPKLGGAFVDISNYDAQEGKIPPPPSDLGIELQHSIHQRLWNYCRSNKIDVILAEYVNMGILAKWCAPNAYIITDTHDILSKRNAMMKKLNLNMRWAYKISEKEEIDFLNQSDAIIAIQEDERKEFQKMGVHVKILTVPYLDVASYTYDRPRNLSSKPIIGYIASKNFLNQQSIDWFLNEILPLIPDIDFELRIAGGIGRIVSSLDSRVRIIGEVDNVEDFYKNCSFLINPTIIGTGLKIKSVEAVARSLPIISTSIGFEGLSLNDYGVLIADDKESFASAVRQMVSDKSLLLNLARKSARNYLKVILEKQGYKQLIELIRTELSKR